MAADAFKRIQPGEKFRPAAEAWNSMLDAVEEYRVRHSFGQAAIDIGNDGRVWIQNDGADDLDQFAIVGIGDAVTLPVDDEGEFLRTMGFGSIAPTAAGRFAILQQNIEVGTMGEARIIGFSHCFVSRTDASHTMASAVDDDYDKLTAAESGMAEILWMDDLPAAAVGETIHEGTGSPGGGLGDDGDYYKDTDADEYYGPKTAGAWGSAHAYGTGVCWAVVVFSLPDASETQRGAVSIGSQVFAGNKILRRRDSNDSFLSVEDWDTGTGLLVNRTDYKSDAIICNEDVFPNSVAASTVISFGPPRVVIEYHDPLDDTDSGGVRIDLDPADGAFGVGESARCTLIGYRVTSGGDKPNYAVVDSTVGPSVTHVGIWQTIAGLSVSGGIITGGTLAVPAAAVSGTFTSAVSLDGGTW